ncbi:Pectinesterase [Phytophthora cinnamomi]|uniref:Pectinesterase n=1 Tax=Phytophthora cinnamomi TaxID=4785 RepID=UPI003559C0B8|nr:Pectinesterase [Phytophthora cinnamomi]
MQLLAPLIALLGLAATAEGACGGPNARITPPTGAIVVDASGAHAGSFRTLAQGVAKLSTTTAQQTVFVYPGVYREQVTVPLLNGPLVLQGYTCDTKSYAANQVTITQAKAQKDIPASVVKNRNDLTTTLLLKSNNVKVYNLNVANTAGNVGQAIAVKADGANSGFYACKFLGFQDTLYANKGPNLYARSYISGAVDFVFGQYAKAWFESCDIVSTGKGCIAANGRDSATNPSEFIFNNANVTGTGGVGTAYLGRPWKPYSRVVWQNSQLSNVINPQGWQKWNGNNNVGNVYLKEYNNRGTGAATNQRVSFGGVVSKPVPITDILGANYKTQWWVDTNFL